MKYSTYLFFSLLVLASCSPTNKLVVDPDFSPASVSADSILRGIPDYSGELTAAKGKGRAVVSEPGNSERITIEFESDTALSLITIKNRIGIEGGKMLVDEDSILTYNKIDKYAQKVSVTDGRLTSLNELASVNLLDLLNFKLQNTVQDDVFESDSHFLLRLDNQGSVLVSKETGLINEVRQPRYTGLPYSRIVYQSYGNAEGYTLPRKITIFSADGESKVLFQIRSLDINPGDLILTIDIPDEIPIQRL